MPNQITSTCCTSPLSNLFSEDRDFLVWLPYHFDSHFQTGFQGHSSVDSCEGTLPQEIPYFEILQYKKITAMNPSPGFEASLPMRSPPHQEMGISHPRCRGNGSDVPRGYLDGALQGAATQHPPQHGHRPPQAAGGLLWHWRCPRRRGAATFPPFLPPHDGHPPPTPATMAAGSLRPPSAPQTQCTQGLL